MRGYTPSKYPTASTYLRWGSASCCHSTGRRRWETGKHGWGISHTIVCWIGKGGRKQFPPPTHQSSSWLLPLAFIASLPSLWGSWGALLLQGSCPQESQAQAHQRQGRPCSWRVHRQIKQLLQRHVSQWGSKFWQKSGKSIKLTGSSSRGEPLWFNPTWAPHLWPLTSAGEGREHLNCHHWQTSWAHGMALPLWPSELLLA